MNAMTSVTAREVQWFAVRMKPNASGGPRTAIVDVEKEQYINRAGQKSWRKVKGTGNRVFLPEHLMKRAGFEVFLPVKKVLRIKNRFTKEKHLVSVPLLADWMFVGLPIVETEYGRGVPGWKKLMELDVVAGVMGTGGRPILMSDSTVMRLMRQFSSGRVPSEVKRRVAARRVFGVGDVAKVVHGPFEDFDFKIVEVGDSSAKGVVNLFGRDNLMELGLENLSTK
ncbi:transcription termination/antitermination protein NusG [Sulfitobacter pontiacus]|uniref:transcription termination/antitermination protein NusG n=1 Tax=Sulfitobacter pontiacus TaxID=60137 RepID=UPI0030ECCD9A